MQNRSLRTETWNLKIQDGKIISYDSYVTLSHALIKQIGQIATFVAPEKFKDS